MSNRNGKPSTEQQTAFSAQDLREIDAAVLDSFLEAEPEAVLRLLPVDPWHIYAFWSVSPADIAAARGSRPEDTPLVLRFYDQSPAPAHPPFDIAVQGGSNGWYVDLWQAGKSYVAELGVGSGGSFVAMARSNPVELPPAGPSPDTGFQVAEVRPPRDEPAAAAAEPAEVSDLFLPVFPQRDVAPEFPLAPSTSHAGDDQERAAVASLPDEPASVSIAFAAPSDEAAAHLPETPPAASAASAEETAADFPIAAPPSPEENDADVAAAQASFPLVWEDGHSSATREAQEEEAKALQAVDAAMPDGGPAAPSGQPLPLESLASVSSFALGRDTEFQLNAELHIYGRARPGSVLSLYGRPVALAQDGTFSIRRPLPDGALILPVLLAGGNGGGAEG